MAVLLDTTWKTDGLHSPFMKEEGRTNENGEGLKSQSKGSFIRKIDKVHCDSKGESFVSEPRLKPITSQCNLNHKKCIG